MLLPNTIVFLIFWFLSLALFYFIVKLAVRNGVEQATERILQSLLELKKD